MTTALDNREAWLAGRRKGLGGSDVAAVLGIPGAYLSPFDVWASKHGYSQTESAAMTRGNYLERAVLDWYADHHAPIRPGHAVVGPEDWMLGTPDAFADGCIVEAKTARDAAEWEHGVPPHYEAQVRWYMALCDVDRADVAVFFTFRDEFRCYPIKRNAKVERRMIDLARAWWERHIVGGERPPVEGRLADAWLLDQFPRPASPEVVAASEHEAELARKYRAAEAAYKSAESLKNTLQAQLKEAIGDRKGIQGDGFRVLWSERKGRSGFDAKRLQAEHPDIHAQYAYVGAPTRTFRATFRED